MLIVATASRAQSQGPAKAIRQEGPESGPTATELIERNFFEPEFVMRNQKAIGLTGDQLKSIREEVIKIMPRFTELVWQQGDEAETLIALLDLDRPY
ncbi:MAG: hypothetical protein L0Z50_39405 [Verrucomicrobiales bacterium]|nr:hypothetical protein [Verrucomicrobiales bacterium]